jgi:uncharacterized protein YndB with AHSA1/START domain
MIINDDRIEKVTELAAPVSKVWRALTDHEQFGQWFKVNLDQPFTPGGRSTGHMLEPGWEHVPWLATVERMDPERLFSFRWHDYDSKSPLPPEDQPTTLVEFRLEPTEGGTRLTITESGFAAFPEPRRLEAMRSNTQGWDMQATHIAEYVAR